MQKVVDAWENKTGLALNSNGESVGQEEYILSRLAYLGILYYTISWMTTGVSREKWQFSVAQILYFW